MPRNLEPFSLTREPTSSDMTGLPVSRHASTFAFFGFIRSLGGLIVNSHGWQRKRVTTLLSPKRRIRKSTLQPWWISLARQPLMAVS